MKVKMITTCLKSTFNFGKNTYDENIYKTQNLNFWIFDIDFFNLYNEYICKVWVC